jgi:hypothetical protein
MMNDTMAQSDRDAKSGRFLAGNGGGGRKLGQRNRLGEAFLEDLRDAWNQYGEVALQKCAEDHPEKFCKIIADLLPRTLDLNITTVDATAFANRFAQAAELLGNSIDPPHRPRKPLPNQKVIEHGG